ncbi:hypothetical protein D3C81_1435340 [compost metagenome]
MLIGHDPEEGGIHSATGEAAGFGLFRHDRRGNDRADAANGDQSLSDFILLGSRFEPAAQHRYAFT